MFAGLLLRIPVLTNFETVLLVGGGSKNNCGSNMSFNTWVEEYRAGCAVDKSRGEVQSARGTKPST